MSDDITRAYTSEELREACTRFPERGLYCYKCRTFVPQFASLAGEDLDAMRALALRDTLKAMEEVERITGCPPRWAKIWVLHAGAPKHTSPGPFGPPCRHCVKPLRTERARQCPHCLASWH